MSTNPHGLSSTHSRTNGAEGVAEGFRSERRNRVRTRVHWRVTFFREGAAEAIESVTQNLSSSGFYCLLKAPFAWGDALVCALEVPTYDPSGSGHTVQLECRVRVVRSEALATEGTYGIACQIEDYRFPALDHYWSTPVGTDRKSALTLLETEVGRSSRP